MPDIIFPELKGRTQIFTITEDITAENVIDEVNKALVYHYHNVADENYLYWYRRGEQPILQRTKQVRPEINSKICENHAQEIVTFKDGYFLTEPAFYKSRKDNPKVNREVKKLNDYLYLSGKHLADNKVVDWFHTVGLGVVYISSNDDPEIPVKVCELDPRQAFCVYSRRPGREPVMGINIVANGDDTIIDVFTKKNIFHLEGGGEIDIHTDRPIYGTATKVVSVDINPFGEIPIIEYQYENNRMGAFEPVIPLLDALNTIESNCLDGIEQFIQSLMIFYNCQLGDDEDGNPITPSYIREAGAIFLKSIGQDKADLKILSEQLDQTQTQVLKDNIYDQILHIVGMPSAGSNQGGTSDNVGAVIWRSGWYQAETYAQNTEDLFKEANKRFDKVFLTILKAKRLVKLGLYDFEIQLTRNETANILTKTQAALNLKQLGFSPEITFAKAGVSNDPVADVENSRKYIDMMWSNVTPNTAEGNSLNADRRSNNNNQRIPEDGEEPGSENGEGQNDNR